VAVAAPCARRARCVAGPQNLRRGKQNEKRNTHLPQVGRVALHGRPRVDGLLVGPHRGPGGPGRRRGAGRLCLFVVRDVVRAKEKKWRGVFSTDARRGDWDAESKAKPVRRRLHDPDRLPGRVAGNEARLPREPRGADAQRLPRDRQARRATPQNPVPAQPPTPRPRTNCRVNVKGGQHAGTGAARRRGRRAHGGVGVLRDARAARFLLSLVGFSVWHGARAAAARPPQKKTHYQTPNARPHRPPGHPASKAGGTRSCARRPPPPRRAACVHGRGRVVVVGAGRCC
jgi:hypothetical protein